MDSAYEFAGRQSQDAQQRIAGDFAAERAVYGFAASQQLPRPWIDANRFKDQRCPICGGFGCDGC